MKVVPNAPRKVRRLFQDEGMWISLMLMAQLFYADFADVILNKITLIQFAPE
jgi:hypothetical protein